MAITTLALGEEGGFSAESDATTLAVGEEDVAAPTTMATGEEEPRPTTMAVGEEEKFSESSIEGGIVNPFGAY